MGKSEQDLKARVEELAQTRVDDCYQCGKCAAGCPRGEDMELSPTRIMRAAQTGGIMEAASSDSIWRCVSCLTCSARCPKEVGVSSVIDAMRQIAIETKNLSPSAAKIVMFQKAFLRNVRRNGRTNEVELGADFEIRYFLRTFDVANAINTGLLGPKMLARGKMHLKMGSPVKDKGIVGRIFARCGVDL